MRSQSNYFFRCFVSLLLSYVLLWSVPLPAAVSASRERKEPSGLTGSLYSPRPQQNSACYRTEELLIRFRAGLSEHEKAVVIASQGARRKGQLRGDSGIEKLALGQDQNPETAAQHLRLNPAVEFAEPNFLINHDELRGGFDALPAPTGRRRPLLDQSRFNLQLPFSNLGISAIPQTQDMRPNDARFAEQWALSNTGQSGGQFGSDIGVTRAWQQTTGSASTVIVAYSLSAIF